MKQVILRRYRRYLAGLMLFATGTTLILTAQTNVYKLNNTNQPFLKNFQSVSANTSGPKQMSFSELVSPITPGSVKNRTSLFSRTITRLSLNTVLSSTTRRPNTSTIISLSVSENDRSTTALFSRASTHLEKTVLLSSKRIENNSDIPSSVKQYKSPISMLLLTARQMPLERPVIMSGAVDVNNSKIIPPTVTLHKQSKSALFSTTTTRDKPVMSLATTSTTNSTIMTMSSTQNHSYTSVQLSTTSNSHEKTVVSSTTRMANNSHTTPVPVIQNRIGLSPPVLLSTTTSQPPKESVLTSTTRIANNSHEIRPAVTQGMQTTSVLISTATSSSPEKAALSSTTPVKNNSKLLSVTKTTNQFHKVTRPVPPQKTTVSIQGTQPNPENMEPVYLAVKFNGRLGNLMFEFASLIGTARLHNVTPVMEPNDFLTNTFNINIPKIDSEVITNFTHLGEKRPCAYDTLNGNFSTNITLYGYLQSWRYFKTAFSEIKQHFSFRDKVIKRAFSGLLASLTIQHGNISTENLTFVGVHVRRGDFLWEDKIKFGYVVGSVEYLHAAMALFVTNYGSVMFVVCSDDMNWTKSVIPRENATFIENKEAELDMATLSLCNHTIMTSGSFGWWSGFLAGGSTVYQKEQVTPGSDLSKQFDLRDYMLPDWIGISKSGNISNVTL